MSLVTYGYFSFLLVYLYFEGRISISTYTVQWMSLKTCMWFQYCAEKWPVGLCETPPRPKKICVYKGDPVLLPTWSFYIKAEDEDCVCGLHGADRSNTWLRSSNQLNYLAFLAPRSLGPASLYMRAEKKALIVDPAGSSGRTPQLWTARSDSHQNNFTSADGIPFTRRQVNAQCRPVLLPSLSFFLVESR